jgi:large subunit ribosomal protein L17
MSHLAAALFRSGRIETTLAKAKALRPFAEKIITMAKKAQAAEVPAERIHFRRLAVARVQDEAAVKQLFVERAGEFMKRPGGYTRIYKLVPRRGDAAKMALIELIAAEDKGYKKPRRSGQNRKSASPSASASPASSSSTPDLPSVHSSTLDSSTQASWSSNPSVAPDLSVLKQASPNAPDSDLSTPDPSTSDLSVPGNAEGEEKRDGKSAGNREPAQEATTFD